jgi:hypothetical protein
MPLTYFDDLFDYCHAWFARYYQPAEHNRFNLIRFDSTIVTLSAHLLTQAMRAPGCKSRTKPARQAVKYSVGFNGSFAVKAKAYFQNTYHNENVALSELIHQTDIKPTDVAIFDRGLNGKKRLSALSVADIRFVTRISATNLVERCGTLRFSTVVGQQDATVEVEEDTLVYGFTEREQKVDTPFRLVVCRQLLTGERLYFLTNLLDVKALEVAQLYRLRWQIETFFKCLKQHMHFTHLLSRQPHTVQIMLYMSLIGTSLLYLYRKLNEVASFKLAKLRFMQQLQLELMRVIWEQGYGQVLFTNENLAGP